MSSEIPEILIEKYHELVEESENPLVVARAPGRIEILGNHTDYNGGLVLASTIDKFVWTLGTLSDEIRLHSIEFNETSTFDLNSLQVVDDKWSNYARGVFWAFKRRNHDITGLTAIIHGNIPQGGGLSSSAALQVSLVNAIAYLNKLDILPKSKAMLAFESERLFCGIACGVMDQFTSQLSKPHALLEIHCGNLLTHDVIMPPEASFVIVNSMVSRESRNILNDRKNECRLALQSLQEAGWYIPNLSATTASDVEKISEILDEKLLHRVMHIIQENQRVREGIVALKENNIMDFGKLMIESHNSSRDLYEVSHPNLELLMKISKNQKGVFGCRLSGAGLGGNLLLLTRTSNTEEIRRRIVEEYERESGLIAESSVCAIPGGVVVKEKSNI